uniref:Uncharacterized protein n=1 Tax=Strigamia maritima TaxID=126957 RepID=T1JIJ5_STRMM
MQIQKLGRKQIYPQCSRTMASLGSGHPVLFTIEQIELIRRLRSSGISKEQVVQAFEELDRLDAELGRSYPVPMGASRATNQMGGGGLVTGQQLGLALVHLQLQQQLLRQQAAVSASAQRRPSSEGGEPAAASPPTQTSDSPPATPQTSNVNPNYLSNTPANQLTTPPRLLNGHHDQYLEDQAELLEFMKQGDMVILEEIRKFVMKYNIKQHFIAEMTKISQAYVSRYFRGEVAEMTERTKTAIYSWYLTCKKNPWKLKQICPNSGVKRMLSDSGDLIPLKRERFTFKAAHLAILEKYYNADPYPDTQTREQIVEECNRAMTKPDRDLTDKERVTLNVVTNWFNNRRKEAKQKLKQQGAFQGLDLSQSLPSQDISQAMAMNWDHLQAPTHIVCQPDIEPSESDQSQDDSDGQRSVTGRSNQMPLLRLNESPIEVKLEPGQ